MQPTDILKGPIPGQSLTDSPDMASPWEQAPKFNTANQALDHLFDTVTKKSFIDSYDTLLKEDKRFYVDSLVSNMLVEGFVNGLWTVDVMMLLVEPLLVIMVWAAAQLRRSPSFSNDSGYEDRTGFEELTGMMVEEADEAEVEPTEAPTEEEPLSPLTSDIPASPLTEGM